jgi:hypothetical protein
LFSITITKTCELFDAAAATGAGAGADAGFAALLLD